MLRRLARVSLPTSPGGLSVRRQSTQPFHKTDLYRDGALVTAVFGYAYSFLLGCEHSGGGNITGILKSGVAHSLILGSAFGLPVAVTWPVSVPVIAFCVVVSD